MAWGFGSKVVRKEKKGECGVSQDLHPKDEGQEGYKVGPRMETHVPDYSSPHTCINFHLTPGFLSARKWRSIPLGPQFTLIPKYST